MTAAAALHMLLGAALVALGVIAAALADRIRGLRVAREPERSRRAPIEVVESRPEPKAKAKSGESALAGQKAQGMADEVLSALIAAGYKKPVASEAVWGCSAQERETIEHWTRAALRRCAKGAAS